MEIHGWRLFFWRYMGGHTLVEIHRWSFIGGHTWVGRIEPVFIFMLQASVRCDNRGLRGLQRGGASAGCDEVVLPCVAMRCFRVLRQNVKTVGEGRASAKYLFRHSSFFSPSSSTFAIIKFRHHCVSPSLCFAVIKFHHHQVSPSSSSFVKFTWTLKGHSRYLQGTSRVQVEPNCVHLDPNLELTT